MIHFKNDKYGTKLPRKIVEEVESQGYRVGYADRRITQWWNDRRAIDDLRTFGGYYFYHVRDTDETFGGFKTASACYRAAYEVVRAIKSANRRLNAK